MIKPYPIRICIGPTCEGTQRVQELKEYISQKEYNVDVTGTGCLQQCDYGPNVIVGKTILSENATLLSRGRKPQRPLEETLDILHREGKI